MDERIRCPKCKGTGRRIMRNNNIGLCLRCLGEGEIREEELNDRRFYRKAK